MVPWKRHGKMALRISLKNGAQLTAIYRPSSFSRSPSPRPRPRNQSSSPALPAQVVTVHLLSLVHLPN